MESKSGDAALLCLNKIRSAIISRVNEAQSRFSDKLGTNKMLNWTNAIIEGLKYWIKKNQSETIQGRLNGH